MSTTRPHDKAANNHSDMTCMCLLCLQFTELPHNKKELHTCKRTVETASQASNKYNRYHAVAECCV